MNAPGMVPCDHVIAKLWEYIDGELHPDSAAVVRAHLDICSRCFPQYDFQRAYKEFVRRSARQRTPPALRKRVFQAILEEEAGAGGGRRALRARLRSALGGVFGRGSGTVFGRALGRVFRRRRGRGDQ